MIKKAFVWFWVQSRMPQRLWKKCMEFSIKNKAGIVEKHYIDPQNWHGPQSKLNMQSVFLSKFEKDTKEKVVVTLSLQKLLP